jgi:hypothetical protein
MSSVKDMARGYTPSTALPSFRRPTSSFDLPPVPSGRTDRDIGHDESKELTYKSSFTIGSGGSWGVFSQEVSVASLDKPHNAADIYLSITAPTLLTAVANGELEVAATVYAWASGSRAVVARGAYLIDVASPLPVDATIFLCSARVGAERFDLTLRVGGPFTENGGLLSGSVGLLGYETGAPNPRKNRMALESSRAASLAAGATIARPCWLHGAIITNPNASATYLQFFDTATQGTVADATPALLSILIPGSSSAVLSFNDEPVDFLSGCVWQSSAQGGTMLATGAQTLTVQRKYA